jgi:hypothetical protein
MELREIHVKDAAYATDSSGDARNLFTVGVRGVARMTKLEDGCVLVELDNGRDPILVWSGNIAMGRPQQATAVPSSSPAESAQQASSPNAPAARAAAGAPSDLTTSGDAHVVASNDAPKPRKRGAK